MDCDVGNKDKRKESWLIEEEKSRRLETKDKFFMLPTVNYIQIYPHIKRTVEFHIYLPFNQITVIFPFHV